MQQALFDAPASGAVRHSDPTSSVHAARIPRGTTAQILDVLATEPQHAFTADELHARIGGREDTLRSALSRLHRAGRVVEAGMGESNTGCPMTRHRLAKTGE